MKHDGHWLIRLIRSIAKYICAYDVTIIYVIDMAKLMEQFFDQLLYTIKRKHVFYST